MKKKLEMIQALSECIAEFEWMKYCHKDQRYQAAIDLCSALLAGLVLWIAIGQRQGEQQA